MCVWWVERCQGKYVNPYTHTHTKLLGKFISVITRLSAHVLFAIFEHEKSMVIHGAEYNYITETRSKLNNTKLKLSPCECVHTLWAQPTLKPHQWSMHWDVIWIVKAFYVVWNVGLRLEWLSPSTKMKYVHVWWTLARGLFDILRSLWAVHGT